MKHNFIKKLSQVTMRLNPYRNADGHIEFSRFIAVMMLEAVAVVLYLFKIMPDLLVMEKPYSLVANFYQYTLVWPLQQLSSVWAMLKDLSWFSHEQADQFIAIGGLAGYVFLIMTAYMIAYAAILKVTKKDFLIGDFLGVWCVPLFLGGAWYFGGMGIDWVVALKASIQ